MVVNYGGKSLDIPEIAGKLAATVVKSKRNCVFIREVYQ